ncbi:MAG: tetratricopeptide repeat protein [bacterium]
MKDNLSYLLSAIELAANIDIGNKKLDNCEFEILKQQPKWQKYLEQQADLLQKAIKVFKNYDKTGNLKYFWQDLKNQKIQFTEGILKQLLEYALLAYERGNLNDAYKMFSFISTYYPKNYNIYLYLGSIIQSLFGFEEAAIFFKNTTSLFPEPDLLFLAAENEFQRKNTEEARNYLQKAKSVLSERGNLTEYEDGLKSRIEELLKALNS